MIMRFDYQITGHCQLDRCIMEDCIVTSYGFDYNAVSLFSDKEVYALWYNIGTFLNTRGLKSAKSKLMIKISAFSESEARNTLQLLSEVCA